MPCLAQPAQEIVCPVPLAQGSFGHLIQAQPAVSELSKIHLLLLKQCWEHTEPLERGWRCTKTPEGRHRYISQKKGTQSREVIFHVCPGDDWELGVGNLKNPEVQMMPKNEKKPNQKIWKHLLVLNKKSIVDLSLNYQMLTHNAIILLINGYNHLNHVLLGHVWFSVSCKAANLGIIPLNSSGYHSNTKVDPEGFWHYTKV